ncbi:hypothetical protein [Dyadobacter bucti]|jgi:hypothetical protein|uniref:hypothetical protein n=1 Tax=Dyadobacter bucti TaxID=2572203 RepID=UPI0011083680|nr:hypothetical protein [Dyadobacter bucti]
MNKKLIPFLLIILAVFQGCRGPEGPQGPEGVNIVGTTFDLTNVNFTTANDFRFGLRFADADVTVLPSDAVLVYMHWNDETVDGQVLKAYRLLPQTAFLQGGGLLTYNYDRTDKDFSVFLDATVNRSTLADDWTKNITFRVVVVPADFAPARTSGAVDYNDYDAVIKHFGIDETKIRKIVAQ